MKHLFNADSEKHLQKITINTLIYLGYLVIRINAGAKGNIKFFTIENHKGNNAKYRNSGIADLLVFRNGKATFIEMKKQGTKNNLSDSQIAFKNLCKIYNITYYIIANTDDLELFINHE